LTQDIAQLVASADSREAGAAKRRGEARDRVAWLDVATIAAGVATGLTAFIGPETSRKASGLVLGGVTSGISIVRSRATDPEAIETIRNQIRAQQTDLSRLRADVIAQYLGTPGSLQRATFDADMEAFRTRLNEVTSRVTAIPDPN
jgi:hypothetical protein